MLSTAIFITSITYGSLKSIVEFGDTARSVKFPQHNHEILNENIQLSYIKSVYSGTNPLLQHWGKDMDGILKLTY